MAYYEIGIRSWVSGMKYKVGEDMEYGDYERNRSMPNEIQNMRL